MRKSLLLIASFCFTIQFNFGQGIATGLSNAPLIETEINLPANQLNLQLNPNLFNPSQLPAYGPQLMGSPCTNGDLGGSASNMFTIIVQELNPIVVDNDINTILFIHRNNATAFGGSSGHLRYDISTNGGASWTSNMGVLNPLLTLPARYPNAGIYNPPGNTNPDSAFIVYEGPLVNGTVWSGLVTGVRQLDGTGGTENYNQAGAGQTLIPRNMVQSEPGIFWAVDYIYTGAAYTGYRVFKGTWNGTDVVWTVNTTFTPPFNLGYNGTIQMADIAIAFDPSGQIGYVCGLTHITPGPANFSFYPVFWKTTDGGNTWGNPEQVNIAQYSCIAPNIAPGNFATTGFDLDLTVDVNGNPHAIIPICNGNNGYAVFYTSWHHVFDVTKEHGMWNMVDISNVNAGRTTVGIAPNTAIWDMEPQISRTDDGTKIFFFWEGSEVALPLGDVNPNPNLWGSAYDVVNREWTTVRNFTSCNVNTAGKIIWPKASPNSLDIAGGYEIPIAYGEFTVGTDPTLIANFRFLDSVYYTNSDFILPQCTVSVSIDQGTIDTLCMGETISITGTYDQILWSNGGTTNSTAPTVSGTYWVAARNACCVGGDSITIVFDSTVVADFSYIATNLNVSFTDLSAYGPLSWAWDFGDGNNSSLQNPSHNYLVPGTYNVCLIVTDDCGADTLCDSVTVTCIPVAANFSSVATNLSVDFTDISGGNPFGWAWDFGDGGFSNLQNPTNVYILPGIYIVCLEITDTCGTSIICDTLTITCPNPVAAFSTTSNNLVIDFTDLSAGSPNGWSWDFGDGGTSIVQSPSHTYILPGTYDVCLIIADTCGNDTICQQIVVTCPAPNAAYQFLVTGNTVDFTDVTLGSPNGWFWDFGDGGTSILQNPSHFFTTTDVYIVCLTVTDTCGSDTLCQNVTVTAIDDLLQNQFLIFPNPSPGIFMLESKGNYFGNTEISIINPLGQILLSVNELLGPDFNREFDLREMPKGIYLLQLNGERIHEVHRVVID